MAMNNFSGKHLRDWTHAIHEEYGIRRRTCTTFIPNLSSKSNDPNERRCGCKRLRREHSWDAINSEETKWNKEIHTRPAFNNAYGCLPNSHANYIRCDIETEPEKLVKFMFNVWNVKRPRLVMCIIGGAKYFKLNERLEREFIKGIIQVALKADGWIVTSGFKTGVVQLVGEAIHDHKVTNPRSHITAIGCSKWGATSNRDELILKKHTTNDYHNIDTATSESKSEKGQQSLEPNHTHFLLLDDGTYFGYDIGDYRTRFAHAISKYDETNSATPTVTIVVEGGPDTLSAIYNDLRIGIPVVLIDGSGRIPNLLATFLARTETLFNQNEKKDNDFYEWQEIIDIEESEKLRSLFSRYEEEIRHGLKSISKGSKTSDKEVNDLLNYFVYCLQPSIRTQIKVYSLESDRDLDDTIFEAIIQSKKKKDLATDAQLQREQLLRLALAWDAIEVAKEHIIKDDLNDLNFQARENLFLEALILDRPKFINTFIKLNFNLSEMFYERKINEPWKLKWTQLARLYKDNEQKKKERLYLLTKCHGKPEIDSPNELDGILRNVIGDYMKPIYCHSINKRFNCFKVAPVSDSRICLNENGNEYELEILDPDEYQNEVQEFVYRDLFLWSILTNRIEISKIFLSHMKTRVCSSLIASKILKSYLNFAIDNESKDILRSQAQEFEEYANECLKCCYNFDEDKACEIAIRSIKIFGNVSCLQVAVDADNKTFVSQPCCDQLLNNIWYDKMEPLQATTMHRMKLLFCILTFGLFAPVLILFRKEKFSSAVISNDDKSRQELVINQKEEIIELKPKQTNRLNYNGINYSDNYVWNSTKFSKVYLKYFRNLKHFHESPIVKYSYNVISYILFLLFFSYFLLFNFEIPKNEIPNIHWTEILVIIIVSTMVIEEIRQFICQDNRTFSGKLSNYFIKHQFHNLLGIVSYLLFYIGLILRFTYTDNEQNFSVAKIILAYDLEVWFIRSLTFLGIAQKMGPKIVMIRKMTIDLFFFTYIILIAMIAYGVASRTMYNFNDITISFDIRSIFRHIIYPTYYLMYGNLNDELGGLDENPDQTTSIATHILLAFHMLFVNILLINLLIAMFSFTFESVQTHTDLVWRYERYSLIREYFDRPPLFPPFIIITHVIEVTKFIFRHLTKRGKYLPAKTFKMIGSNRHVNKDWSEFENYATNLYIRSLFNNKLLSTTTSTTTASTGIFAVKTSKEQQLSLDSTVNSFYLQSNAGHIDITTLADELSTIKKAILDLRTHSEELNRCMLWMMNAIERVKMSKEPKPRIKSAINIDDIKPTDE